MSTFPFAMPELPYATNALEPAIGQQTVEYHYGKHLQTYVNNLNQLTEGTPYASQTLKEVVVNAPEGAILNNAGQVLNHTLYFLQFCPYAEANPGTPPPPLTKEQRDSLLLHADYTNLPHPIPDKMMAAIERDFGTYDNFVKQMNEASAKLFGSGWVWLAKDSAGKLKIGQYANGDNPVRHGEVPILGFDVWEHAYYLDVQNRRAEHIARLWPIIDWDVVAMRME